MELLFDPEKHLYTVNGNRVPSVTQIIEHWIKVGNRYINVFTGGWVAADMFEDAAFFGTDAHTMIAYYLDGDLDRDALSPELNLILQQFIQWCADYEPQIIDNEIRGYSQKYHFAGTRDLKCIIKNKLYLIDFKTGAYDMAGAQLAGYVQIDKENDKSRMTRHRNVLHLPKDGSGYKFIPFSDPNDWSFFLSRLTTYNYVRR